MSARRRIPTTPLMTAILLAGCGAEAPRRPPPATPKTYEGTCVLAGIEQVPAPVGQNEDSIVVVARYRPSDGARASAGVWSVRFQVQRARERDLRQEIEANPTVLCDVDRTKAAGPARIDVPPFEGQQGRIDP